MNLSTSIPSSDDDIVSWSDGGVVAGGAAIGSIQALSTYQWSPPLRFNYDYTIASYPTHRPNPTEAAFKIVAKLLEKGMVEELTVKRFVEIVNDVAEIVRTT